MTAPVFRPEAEQAITAVTRGLEIAAARIGSSAVSSKGGRDLVTDADVAVEDVVRAIVRETLGFTVVGEERGGEAPADGAPHWLVDPICGTRNFASRVPMYCVNLGFVEGGKVTIGVSGDGSTGEVVAAEAGKGAWAMGTSGWRRLATGEDGVTIVAEDSKSSGTRREEAARFFSAVVRADRWYFRSVGSSLGLPLLAAGRVSGYVDFLATALHSGAGVLIATEAGATLTDVHGEPWTLRSDSILAAATPELHRQLLALAGR